jgi:hypothetical protein
MGIGEEVIRGIREWDEGVGGKGVGERGKGVSLALGGKEASGVCVGSKGVDKQPPRNIPTSSTAFASHVKDNPGGLIFNARMAAFARSNDLVYFDLQIFQAGLDSAQLRLGFNELALLGAHEACVGSHGFVNFL